jgi:hypothetical protein
MGGWRALLKADPMDWLLEEDNPSVRYSALVDLEGLSQSEAAVRRAKAAIMKVGPVPKILAKQSNGCWEKPESFYTAKYRGTVWQLLILAALYAAGDDERIRAACHFILENAQDRESGGFSMHRSERQGGGRHSEVIPCLTGNMVWALLRLGCGQDERVRKGIEWITAYQRFDDGIDTPPSGWPYDKYEMCWGRHTCHMGVVKALKALSEIPTAERSRAVSRTIRQGIEYLLIHHIDRKSHDLARVSRPGWRRLGFPLMYQTDILEILGILAKLDCRDQRMQNAVDIVLSKQDERGRWTLENSFNESYPVAIEKKGKPSKWITLNALKMLKGYSG